jgi:hypothetical protein
LVHETTGIFQITMQVSTGGLYWSKRHIVISAHPHSIQFTHRSHIHFGSVCLCGILMPQSHLSCIDGSNPWAVGKKNSILKCSICTFILSVNPFQLFLGYGFMLVYMAPNTWTLGETVCKIFLNKELFSTYFLSNNLIRICYF